MKGYHPCDYVKVGIVSELFEKISNYNVQLVLEKRSGGLKDEDSEVGDGVNIDTGAVDWVSGMTGT